ncbi:MAG: hypothetical protein A3F70_16535 [Acidobacteria bacterium RIFCSPLOWO2_12_FULL_67_14]|nr:MAG: hypothetical protein A3H29_19765 [Acidobacteria bacterium RIFCSPLOWO2_02_FULL_67_21]OFW40801.1 MAG: hypothetical protein A3F70_16535 [Acidobacteria bacterium RIFCSPLOWO2_12_FULL_67_14]
MRALLVLIAVLALGLALPAQQPPAPPLYSPEWYQQFHGPYSAPVEPFRIVGNIHYVGAANIAAYLIATSGGHILIDTGTVEMHRGLVDSVATLGFRTGDIKIVLSSHAHFDHIAGHAVMKRLTGAQVFAMAGDADALESGRDTSALGAVGWEPVKVDRVLRDGETVSLGGTTLRAVHAPGHTKGATTWFTEVQDGGRRYVVAYLGGTTPNAGVPLLNNPRHPGLIEETRRTLQRLQREAVPDIYLPGHPQAMFAGKVARLHAGERPHPLLNADAWRAQLASAETDFEQRVARERAAH